MTPSDRLKKLPARRAEGLGTDRVGGEEVAVEDDAVASRSGGANQPSAFFETFAIIHAVTSGGPARATEILVYKVYRDGVDGSTSAAPRRSRCS